jgi:hypothetical protein
MILVILLMFFQVKDSDKTSTASARGEAVETKPRSVKDFGSKMPHPERTRSLGLAAGSLFLSSEEDRQRRNDVGEM